MILAERYKHERVSILTVTANMRRIIKAAVDSGELDPKKRE